MQYMVKALARSKRTIAYVFIEANTEQQAIDYAITNNRLPVSYGYSAQLIKTESAVMHRNTLQFKNHFDVLLVV